MRPRWGGIVENMLFNRQPVSETPSGESDEARLLSMTDMTTRLTLPLLLSVVIGAPAILGVRVSAAPGPEFQEVYELLLKNLPGVDAPALDKASVEGLLSRFPGRVSLSGGAVTNEAAETRDPVQTRRIEDRFAYVRLERVDAGAAEPLVKGLSVLSGTNALQGGILDLRFSRGTDYQAALTSASLWVAGKRPLLDWGAGVKESEGVNPLGRIPWVVLVNGQTSGAPEAVAAALRQTETALLVGSRTAGQAAVAREFPLKSGGRLLIASQPVSTGDGKAIPASGLTPDILVTVDPERERSSLEDFLRGGAASTNSVELAARKGVLSGGVTNRASGRRRLNEADLVRMQKEGKRPDSDSVALGSESPAPGPGGGLPADPVFLRGLDLLKGLAVVRPARGH